MRPSRCGLCGNTSLALLYPEILIAEEPPTIPRFRNIYACDDCRSYWSVLPGGMGSDEYYRSKPVSAHVALEAGTQRFNRVRGAVEKLLGRGRYSLLDVGCAGGAHLTVYGPGVDKFGVEPSASADALLRPRAITLLGRSIEDLPAQRSFDVVTCLDVLEHLGEPATLLEGIDRHLNPGGVLAVVTGDIDSISARLAGRRWLYYALPEHCTCLSAQALARHLDDRFGYRLEVRTWAANQDIDLSYVRAFLRAVVREAVLRIMPPTKLRALELAGRGRFPFFCDNMLLLFRKPGGRAIVR